MGKKGVEEQHSQTALFAALYRAIACKEFSDERFGPDHMAELFLPPLFRFLIKFRFIRNKILIKSTKLTPGIYEYMIARTAFFDKAFKEALIQDIPQIVLLGAGYDTRVYRFSGPGNSTRIIELDIETTKRRKMKCILKAGIDIPKNMTLAPMDFNRDSFESVLEKAGYDKNLKTVFIWEGVSYYLDPKSVDSTLAFVTHYSHNESVIAFDYTITITEANIDNYHGAKEFAETWKKHRENESFRFSVDEGQIESFLEQRGLKPLSHLDNQEIEQAFLKRDNGSLIGRITGGFRFVTASHKS